MCQQLYKKYLIVSFPWQQLQYCILLIARCVAQQYKMNSFLCSHWTSSCTNAPQCYITRTLACLVCSVDSVLKVLILLLTARYTPPPWKLIALLSFRRNNGWAYAPKTFYYAYVACLVMVNISALNRTKTSKKTFTVAPLHPVRLIYRSFFVIHPRHLLCTTAVMLTRELILSINVLTQLSPNSCSFLRVCRSFEI